MAHKTEVKQRQELGRLNRGQAGIYHHAADGRSYLFCLAEKATKPALNTILQHGSGIFILAPQSSMHTWKQYSLISQDSFGISCDHTLKGLKALQGMILKNALEKSEGPDRILFRSIVDKNLLQQDSAEARLLEILSNLNADHHLLFCAPLLDANSSKVSLDASKKLGKKLGIPCYTADDIQQMRLHHPSLLQVTGVTDVDLQVGKFKCISFFSAIDHRYHWAFSKKGARFNKDTALVRIESECMSGHVLGSELCDCGAQLMKGLERIEEFGCGALIYLRQEGRGIGLLRKLEAYKLQQVNKLDTVEANHALGMPSDARDYLIGAQIMNRLDMKKVHLLTNNPRKVKGLRHYGINIEKRVSHIIPPSQHNLKYLSTKKIKLGHLI